MTINTTIDSNDRTVFGDKKVVYGVSVISGDVATGDVVTGLAYVEHFLAVVQGDTQKGCSINEDLPLSSGDVTVVTESNNQTFIWMALGH